MTSDAPQINEKDWFKKNNKKYSKKGKFQINSTTTLGVGTFLTFLDKSDVSPQTVHVAALERSTVNVKGSNYKNHFLACWGAVQDPKIELSRMSDSVIHLFS